MFLRGACLLLVVLGLAECSEVSPRATDVCYGDLGCFTTKAPFGGTVQRPMTILPDSPTKIKTQFLLYTRYNMNAHLELSHTGVADNNIGQFNETRLTKFIIHGFLQSSIVSWAAPMKNALLAKGDYNVIVVDWSNGNGFPYNQASVNTQMVGAEIVRLVNALMEHAGLDLSDVHIIGHSLGAHAAGYAGKRLRTIARITGLDPAEPNFQFADPVVRLDSTDADFVDVVHTDGDTILLCGWGMSQPIGHVDFYPNGGMDQPGCPSTVGKMTNSMISMMFLNFGGIVSAISCSHSRATDYFVDTIRSSCPSMAFPCANYKDFAAGKCFQCPGGACPRMGFSADLIASQKGSYYLMTGASSTFCRYHYFVTVKTTSSTNSRGAVQIKLIGSAASDDYVDLFKSDSELKASTSYSVIITSSIDLGNITSVKIKFKKSLSLLTFWMYDDNIGIKSVNVLAAENQQQSDLCAPSNKIQSDSTNTYTLC